MHSPQEAHADGAVRQRDHRSAACSLFAAASRSRDDVLQRRNVEQGLLSAHPRPLVVSAGNGLPHRLDASQHAAVAVDSTGEFTVSVGVVAS